ncbi:MAG: type II toxin-antitoxin system RelE/ParE family toxin [Chloroflexi bacterium]|nr:type II toxin-antitoxin system RelE/ParE family toxin [Chloroflexota bacterium]
MYRLRFTAAAERDVARLDPAVRRRILKRLEWLGRHAESFPHQALQGPLGDLFKFRVGDYRVLYDLARPESVIWIHRIEHRREVYQEK